MQSKFMKINKFLGFLLVLLAICFLPQLFISLHHRLIFGLNSLAIAVILLIILLVSIPFVIKIYRWLKEQWSVKSDDEPILLFAMGALCFIISFAITGNTPIDIHLHDTYYIISYSSIVMLVSFFCGIFCIIYFLISKIFRRHLNIFLSRFHFWITFVGLNLLFSIRLTDHIISEPRRYVEYSGWPSYQHFEYFNRYVLFTVILIMVAQLLFIFNIIYALFKGRR